MKLMERFGAHLDLPTVDQNIATLIRDQNGSLEAVSNDEMEIVSGALSADLQALAALVCASLSSDVVNIVKTLLSNVEQLLSVDGTISSTQRIDVQLFSNSMNECIVVHIRYQHSLKKNGVRVFFLSGRRR
jgi:hypothetical protein